MNKIKKGIWSLSLLDNFRKIFLVSFVVLIALAMGLNLYIDLSMNNVIKAGLNALIIIALLWIEGDYCE